MDTTELEKKQFSLRPSTDVHERLSQAAAWQGQTLHAFVLGAAVREADDVLSSRDRIRLRPEDADLVLSLLETEPERNVELTQAFKKRAEVLGEQVFEKLSREHDRESFDCGVPELNLFLRQHARRQQDSGVSRTFVLVDQKAEPPKVVFGFFTLVATQLDSELLDKSESREVIRRLRR